MDALPYDICVDILRRVSPLDCVVLERVNQKWRNAVQTDYKHLLKELDLWTILHYESRKPHPFCNNNCCIERRDRNAKRFLSGSKGQYVKAVLCSRDPLPYNVYSDFRANTSVRFIQLFLQCDQLQSLDLSYHNFIEEEHLEMLMELPTSIEILILSHVRTEHLRSASNEEQQHYFDAFFCRLTSKLYRLRVFSLHGSLFASLRIGARSMVCLHVCIESLNLSDAFAHHFYDFDFLGDSPE